MNNRARKSALSIIALLLVSALPVSAQVEGGVLADIMLKHTEERLRANPRSHELHFYLGYYRARLERYSEAIEAYRRAISLKPDFAEARYNLALLYIHRLEQKPALDQYNELLRLDRELADALHGPVTTMEDSIVLSAIEKVYPETPGPAKLAGASGAVIVEVEIYRTGVVKSARALYGHGLLREPAERAAMRWRFRPLRGDMWDRKASGTITFTFAR